MAITLFHHPFSRAAYLRWSLFSPSVADCIFGGAVRYLLRFKMLEPTPTFSAYAERLAARPAAQKADARNAAIAKEHGLGG